jgi:hypothetical protein
MVPTLFLRRTSLSRLRAITNKEARQSVSIGIYMVFLPVNRSEAELLKYTKDFTHLLDPRNIGLTSPVERKQKISANFFPGCCYIA